MAFCKAQIGREASKIRFLGLRVILYFEPELSSQEKQALNQNLPPFVEKFWSIIVEDLEAEPPPEYP